MSTTNQISFADRRYMTVAPGVEVCLLRRHGQEQSKTGALLGAGSTVVFRMAKGAHAPLHDHPGGEETYLVSGRLRIGDTVLLPGDYFWTQEGESHDGVAEEDTVFFVVLPGGVKVL